MKYKKITKILFVLALIISLFGVCFLPNMFVKVQAASNVESEPNDSVANADVIPINGEIIGNSDGEKETDWYKFTVPASGCVFYTFEHELIDEGIYERWNITIYGSDAANGVDSATYDAKVYGNKNYTSAKYGLTAGTYYLKVKSTIYEITSDYKIKVNFVETNSWETEINNTKNDADSINVNSKYTGYISWKNSWTTDEDWYKFELLTESLVSINFDHELITDGIYERWYVYLYDSTGVNPVLDGIKTKYTVYGKTNLEIKEMTLPKGTYYIMVKGNSSHLLSLEYNLIVNESHEHVYEECEQLDKKYHTQKCTICGATLKSVHNFNNGTVLKSPSCKETGLIKYKCKSCGFEKEEELQKTNNHNYGKYETVDGDSHSRTCTICNNVETNNHRWDGGIVTEKSTCTTEGTKLYTCNDCKATKSEKLPVEHVYSSFIFVDTTTHKEICLNCLAEKSSYHNWKEGSVIKESTCSVYGEKQYLCEQCNGTKIEYLPYSDVHNYVHEQLDENQHKVKCTDCDSSYNEEHVFNKLNENKNDDSKHCYTCECGKETFEEHTVTNWEETKTFFKMDAVGKCDICGHEVHKSETILMDSLRSNSLIILIVVGVIIFIISIIFKRKK